MDFLNKSFAQLRDLFLSMTPGARITTALLLAVVVVSVAYLFHFQVTGPDAFLMGGEPFSSDRLSVMEAAFGKAGLNGYQRDGNRIRIPQGKEAVYMAALLDAEALPPSFGSYLDRALAKEGVFESKRTKEERLKVAKQQELSLIIRKMRGVRNAAVLYDRREGTGLTPHDVATASVSIEPTTNEPLDPQRIRAIRKLVAAAFAGLRPDDVTVADLNGPIYASAGDDGVGDGTDDAYFNTKLLYEKALEQDIRSQLAHIPGVRVQVSAELDKEISHEENRVVLDAKKSAPVTSRTRTLSSSNQAGPPGGRPGLAAQGGPASAPVSVAATRSSTAEEKSQEEETKNAIPSEHVVVRLKGMTPRRVRASVVVPSSYYRAIWKQKNKPAAGKAPAEPTEEDLQAIEATEKKNIANAVAPLLPTGSDNVDPVPLVTVTTFQSLAVEPIAAPALADTALAWLGDHWSTLATAALAFFSLLMVRSMIKAASAPEAGTAAEPVPALSVMSAQEGTSEPADDAAEGGAAKTKRRFAKGPSYKDDLAEMVRDDPEAAATILRAWIAAAG